MRGAWDERARVEDILRHMGGRLLTTEQAEGIRYHHPDRLGTRLVTDASDGVVISEQLTMPFGTQVPYGSTLGGDNSWQHPGRINLQHPVQSCQGFAFVAGEAH